MPASAVLMVRPSSFGYNSQTASSNFFQNQVTEDQISTTKSAIDEFNYSVELIRSAGITVIIQDLTSPEALPDAVFPNNWISFLPGGTVVIYPMMAANRRLEKQTDIIGSVCDLCFYKLNTL